MEGKFSMTSHSDAEQSEKNRQLARSFQQAVECHERGQIDEADQLYRAVLAADPQHFGALDRLGILRAQQGKLDEAVTLLRKAVDRQPHSAAAQYNLGNALRAFGRIDEARTRYQTAIALKPDFAEAHNNLGIMLHAANLCAPAITHYKRVIALRPDYAGAHNNLGKALRALNRLEEAKACYETALSFQPSYPSAHNNLGEVLQALGRHGEAVRCYEKVLALKPDYAEARHNLGNALQALDRHHEAKTHYECALALKPDNAEAHNNFGNTLYALGCYEEALAQYQRALALRPGYAEAHSNLGNALHALNRCEAAVTQYERAIALKPDYADAHRNLGISLVAIGQLPAACQAFATAIAIAPKRANFYFSLSECKTFTADDPHLMAMENLSCEAASLSVDDRINLHFALGKAWADIGQPDRSFEHLLTANGLKRQQIAYDQADTLATIDRISAVFTPELMRTKQGLGDPSSVPIFILGMPRSGSTLIEQILASHPDVFGAGELDALNQTINSLRRRDGGSAKYPELVPALSGTVLREIGSRYLDRIRVSAPSALRITDKMPSNCFMAGLIHLILPNARIIHTRRDPVDTCLSCFSKLFKDGHPWSYELGELGRFYRAYESLMEHWRGVLPEGVMLEVQYEDVVADLEGQARRILAHCGLAWNDACLAFHRAERPVKTASAAQVRQPIYQSSVGRWHLYGRGLQPLLDALGHDHAALTGERATEAKR